MSKRAVVLLSGGLDSCILLTQFIRRGVECYPISFVYGQRHNRELDAAADIAGHFGLQFKLLDIQNIFSTLSGCLIDGSEIPTGMTYEELKSADGVAKTYVPYRNGILLSIATAYAYDIGATIVAYAAHATDARGGAYPDCTPVFANSQSETIFYGTGSQVILQTPFINLTKGEVLKQGLDLEAPLHLTWSCYLGGEKPCGECPTCLERAEAFRFVGAEDPTISKE